MGDLFDEFMKELERRRAEAEGRSPRRNRSDEGAVDTDNEHNAEPAAAEDADTGSDEPGDRPDEEPPEPTPLRPRRRRATAGGPPRGPRSTQPVGGPDDGAGPPSLRGIIGRLGIGAVVIGIILILVLGGIAVDLWTDAIWYKSVGFDSVFWTRLGAQAGLFAATLAIAAVVLLGNLWLAGRLVPPPNPERPGGLRSIADRIAEAQRQADRGARMAGGQFRGPFGGPFGTPSGPAGREEAAFSFDEDMPDLVPLARLIIAGV